MSEDKKNDTVSIDEHNRIVATANARQAELEDMRRQVSDLKSKVSDVESIQKAEKELGKHLFYIIQIGSVQRPTANFKKQVYAWQL